MLRFRMCGDVTSPPQYAFMLWRLIKHRTKTALYLYFNNEPITLIAILCYGIHSSVCSVVFCVFCCRIHHLCTALWNVPFTISVLPDLAMCQSKWVSVCLSVCLSRGLSVLLLLMERVEFVDVTCSWPLLWKLKFIYIAFKRLIPYLTENSSRSL